MAVVLNRVTFNIVNLTKPDSLFNLGMRPVLYSYHDAQQHGLGWVRTAHDISYRGNLYPRQQQQPTQPGTPLQQQQQATGGGGPPSSSCVTETSSSSLSLLLSQQQQQHGGGLLLSSLCIGSSSFSATTTSSSAPMSPAQQQQQQPPAAYYTLSFSVEFCNPGDVYLIAHSYPYTLSDHKVGRSAP